MKSLQPVNEHRPVRVVEDILPDFHNAVWPDSDQVSVEGGVMEAAQRNAVRHGRFTERVGVRQNVGRLDQLLAFQPTDCTVELIGPDDSFTERRLVQALSEEPRRIPSSR